MRIQHNIAAMNSYRNYTNNSTALSKNLEKLSSGYKINRAGDDAAGLAISEKMRAQITGLEVAQKNAKDGISLVKTAEGALTEVHDMLNRMYELSEQSANGTYDNEVDRAQLQKEISSLSSEIDRIADSSNFNGIKLLDGSLSATGASKSGAVSADLSKLGVDITADAEDVTAVKGKYTMGALLGEVAGNALSGIADGDSFSMTVNFTDSAGKDQSVTVKLTAKTTSGASTVTELWLDDGSETGKKLAATMTDGAPTAAELGTAFVEALGKDDAIKANFKLTGTASPAFEAITPGTSGAVLNSVEFKSTKGGVDTAYATKVDVTTKAADATKAYDLSKAKIWNNGTASSTEANAEKKLEDAIFEVNGEKFVFVNEELSDEEKAALKEAGVSHWVNITKDGAIANANVTAMAEKIQTATGLKVETGTFATGAWTSVADGGAASTKVVFKDSTSTSNSGTGGLTLQIGDTAEDFNKLTVSIKDMHVKAMGIGDIDISKQGGASEAMAKVKSAINYVSDVRGTLGATQNRLDHTINNLSVMQENIQDAESSIRDVDVAKEMMDYTKNNILVQSAQAMLAQANQLPQGVLQLLQ